jgi:hypothetical protein
MNDLKSGWKTTEWWTTMAGMVGTIVVALGVASGDVVAGWVKAVVAVVAAVFTVASAVHYTMGRVEQKKALLGARFFSHPQPPAVPEGSRADWWADYGGDGAPPPQKP